jgi:5-(carboxyamino)imidazole ribonucleotide synthase
MRVGIFGGGQLARMMALEAHRLGIEPVVLDPKPGGPSGRVAHSICAGWDDPAALDALASCDVVTYEFENVPPTVVESLARRVRVHPPPAALRETCDRLSEKRLLQSLGIATADFRAVDSRSDLERAMRELGLPAVLKTRRFGYDGRGQLVLREPEDIATAWHELGGAPLILEELVDFDREVSLIAVRAADGEVRMWDPTENTHVGGTLRISRAPSHEAGGAGFDHAKGRVAELLEHLEYVGVAAVEFFLRGDEWVANEVACRVHNSGHWTQDGAVTSQFENHLRAVTGMPLGSTRTIEPSAMVNLIGRLPSAASMLRLPDARLHGYDKSPAPGRKLGHVNVTAPTRAEVERHLRVLVHEIAEPGAQDAFEASTR